MKVKVVAFGMIREAIGLAHPGDSRELELTEGASVTEAIEALGLSSQQVFSILVDGGRVEASETLREGAEVTLMPPFTGGA